MTSSPPAPATSLTVSLPRSSLRSRLQRGGTFLVVAVAVADFLRWHGVAVQWISFEQIVPMSRVSDVFFAVMGLALGLHFLLPAQRNVRRIAVGLSALATAIALHVLFCHLNGREPPWESWLGSAALRVNGVSVEHMSTQTAVLALLSNFALLALLSPPAGRALLRDAGIFAALAVELFALVTAVSYAAGSLPVTADGWLKVVPLVMAEFALFNFVLLMGGGATDRLRHWFFGTEASSEGFAPVSHEEKQIFGLLAALVLAALAASLVYLRIQTGFYRNRSVEVLQRIADLKVGEIEHWRHERMADAQTLMRMPGLGQNLNALGPEGASNTRRAAFAEWLQQYTLDYGYADIVVFDAALRPVLRGTDAPESAPPGLSGWLRGLRPDSNVVELPPYVDATGHLRWDLLVPLPGPDATTLEGAVLLQTDPTRFIIPILQSWPAEYQTGQSVLWYREGDLMTSLGGYRPAPGVTPEELRPFGTTRMISKLPPDSLPARVWRGDATGGEGPDYRGVLIVGVGRLVPNSPWMFSSRLDSSEVYAPLRRTAVGVAGVVAGLLVIAGLATSWLWRQRQRNLLHDRIHAELEQKRVAARLGLVMRHAKDMIFMTDEKTRFIEVNQQAVDTYGWSREELLQMSIPDLRADDGTGLPPELLDLASTAEGVVYETVHRRKDGTTFPVENSVRRIEIDGQAQLLGIVRDVSERKRAEKELREGAERYHSIISVSNTGAWEYYADPGHLWCSPEYFSMLGRDHRDFDLSGKPNLQTVWIDLLHPDDLKPAAEAFTAYLTNGSVGTYENYFRMRHQSGEWIWIWSRGKTQRDANGRATNRTVGTHIDITERRKAAVALEAAHADLQVRIKELRCLYAISKLIAEPNRSVGQVLAAAVDLIPPGWQHSELARAKITFGGQVCASTGFKATAWMQAAEIPGAGGPLGTVEVCYLEEPPGDAGGPFAPEEQTLLANIATQLGVMIERRIAEDKLHRLSSIIEQAPLSVVITDLAGAIEYVNPKFCTVTGRAKEEVMGRDAWADGTRELQPEVFAELWAALTANQVWTGELRNRKKSGEIYLENVVTAPLVEENGRATHYVALKDDITAQKRFETETTAMLAKEREVSDMKSQFISVASHEFRTPLAAAVGSLELLERHAGRLTDAKRGELLVRAQHALGRLTAIMNDVLQVSRADSGRVKVRLMNVDLGRFVQDVLNEVAEGDRQAHTFSFQQSGGPATVPADTNLLNHVVSNLIGNAARYSPAGTKITVTLALEAEAFTVTVADEGIGIPEAEREHIFEPFVRGSNVGQIGGTGLGLNIVKRYTELMGGRIEVLPTGRGATFRIRVPCLNPAPSS